MIGYVLSLSFAAFVGLAVGFAMGVKLVDGWAQSACAQRDAAVRLSAEMEELAIDNGAGQHEVDMAAMSVLGELPDGRADWLASEWVRPGDDDG